MAEPTQRVASVKGGIVTAQEGVSVEQAQALARKLSVVSAQMRIQRARAEFEVAKAVMLAAQQAVERENANLEVLLKGAPAKAAIPPAPGYKPGAYFDDTGEMVVPPEVKK